MQSVDGVMGGTLGEPADRDAQSAPAIQAGYLPVPLSRIPPGALRDIPIFVRAESTEHEFFTKRLATAEKAAGFDAVDVDVLIRQGARIVYIRTADHARFQQQVEAVLLDFVSDPLQATAKKAMLVYETSLALVDDLMRTGDVTTHLGRLEQVSRVTVALALRKQDAFSHLFAASRHDFYTATHMVNVATWMVPLACALGYQDPEELTHICLAGLLHDVGKILVPSSILNKREPLTAEEWQQIRSHAATGQRRLLEQGGLPDVVPLVARQHHERLDGSGYPDGLRGAQIAWPARICAVVDTFDAMTAMRPFKTTAKKAIEAVVELQSLSPQHYDPKILQAWRRLLAPVLEGEQVGRSVIGPSQQSGTEYGFPERLQLCHIPTEVYLHSGPSPGDQAGPSFVVVRRISRSALVLVSPVPITANADIVLVLHAPRASPLRLCGRVLLCRRREDRGYDLAVRIVQVQRAPAVSTAPAGTAHRKRSLFNSGGP